MGLLTVVKNVIVPPRATPPQVDQQLYSNQTRINLQQLINEHHFQYANKGTLSDFSSRGFAYIGATVCEDQNEKLEYFNQCATQYGAIKNLSPLELIYGPHTLTQPESHRNFIITKAVASSRVPNLELYHTFVRYALPTTLPQNEK